MSKKEPQARWVLPNGLVLLYRQSTGLPLAAGTLLLKTGSLYEKAEEAGLANLTTELLFQGTRRRSAIQIANEIESIGASLGAQVSEDYSDIGFVVPESKLGVILNLVVEVLTDPAFLSRELEKERDHVLAGLKSRHDQIFNRAYDALNAALFGSHPYGRPVDGLSETVKHFSRDKLAGWHASHVRPDRAIFSLVASLPVLKAQQLLERAFRNWHKPSQPLLPRQFFRLEPPRQDEIIRLSARFEQAYLMTGTVAPSVFSPGYTVLKMLNTILGGGMSSRLFVKLREEQGLAYELSSFFPTHLLASHWVVYLGLPPEKLKTAKKELQKLLAGLKTTPPSGGEIRQAAEMIRGSYLMENQTRRRRSWYAAWWEFLGKAKDYEAQFLNSIQHVRARDLRDLAGSLLDQPWVTVEITPK